MGNIAIIKDGVVENVIAVSVEDRASSRLFWEEKGYTAIDDAVAGPGDLWDGSVFTTPAQPEPPAPVDTWLISVGAFYDRFAEHKIPVLASEDTVVQAMVKDSQVRKHIDLQRADLPGMLDVLISKGFALNKAAILETPAAVSELP